MGFDLDAGGVVLGQGRIGRGEKRGVRGIVT